MAHSGIPSRGLRDLRVIDRSSSQVPYLLERRDGPLIVDARLERRDLPAGIDAPQGKPTTYIVNLPYTELPNARLALTTRARVFQRTVTLGMVVPAENRAPARLATIATMQWTHADEETVAPSLLFGLPESRRGDLFLLIDEGDNQPLPIENASVLMPSRRAAVPPAQRDAAPGQDATTPAAAIRSAVAGAGGDGPDRGRNRHRTQQELGSTPAAARRRW